MRPLDSVGVQARMAADDVDQPKARARTDGRGCGIYRRRKNDGSQVSAFQGRLEPWHRLEAAEESALAGKARAAIAGLQAAWLVSCKVRCH
ncbi:hypothetical protein EV679_1508 [Kerstersia gyiorum]|uniref:Uncharacterized protein n=1 Tax=Kerstersia gyiorum TaxID=206506 RepID=A0A4Q7MSZ5_9BURK|nr:hypothetical protein EV679_1508 [Kerstersia gyiorum]